MIPEELHLRNFLSHRETSLDLRGVHVASLVGHNGAGKSALLDAITWAVWGKSRVAHGHEDELIHHGATSSEVEFLFRIPYQNGEVRHFRILRRRELRGRSSKTVLDFQLQDQGTWRTLTQSSVRGTQSLIVEQLGIDYDTFVNSAYLRQGHADEFTVQNPSDRKRVLGAILGLDQWELYRERAKSFLDRVKGELQGLDQQLARIADDLAARPRYEAALRKAEAQLAEVAARQTELQAQVDALHRVQIQAAGVKRALADLEQRVSQAVARRDELRREREEHEAKREYYGQLVSQAETIEENYRAYRVALAQAQTFEAQLRQVSQKQAEMARHERVIAQARTELEQRRYRLEQQSSRHEREIAAAREALLNQLRSAERQERECERDLAAAREALVAQIHRTEQEEARLLQAVEAAGRQLEREIADRRTQIAVQEERLPAASLRDELAAAQAALAELETVAQGLTSARAAMQSAELDIERLQEHNRQLAEQIGEYEERRQTLHSAEAACPLCRQPLTTEHRAQLLTEFTEAKAALLAQKQANQAQIEHLRATISAQREQIAEAERVLQERARRERRVARLQQQLEQGAEAQARIRSLQDEIAALETRLAAQEFGQREREALSAVRLRRQELQAQLEREQYGDEVRERLQEAQARQTDLRHQLESEAFAADARAAWAEVKLALEEVAAQLEQGAYAREARAALAQVQAALEAIGYDADAHARLRDQIAQLQAAEQDFRELEKARLGIQAAEEALRRLQETYAAQQQQVAALEAEYQARQTELEELQAQLRDLPRLERALGDVRQRMTAAHQAVAVAQQNLAALETLVRRKERLQQERESLAAREGRLKELREAFGVNGIPAMLIEHALPALEAEANHILGRLSDGRMHVRFDTQRETKRKTLRETLDIIISDEKGTRPYENFSGGEQFRINFAIRVALSRLLAQRSGVRLRSLFVDEGFGSLDAEGRQRLVSAVRAIQDEFDLILVITHVEELRDTFPTRVEVGKLGGISVVEVR